MWILDGKFQSTRGPEGPRDQWRERFWCIFLKVSIHARPRRTARPSLDASWPIRVRFNPRAAPKDRATKVAELLHCPMQFQSTRGPEGPRDMKSRAVRASFISFNPRAAPKDRATEQRGGVVNSRRVSIHARPRRTARRWARAGGRPTRYCFNPRAAPKDRATPGGGRGPGGRSVSIHARPRRTARPKTRRG